MKFTASLIAAAAATIAAASITTVVLADSTGAVDPRQPVNVEQPAAAVGGPSLAEKEVLAVFRRPAEDGDTPPADVIDWRAKAQGAAADSGRLIRDASGDQIFVVPADGGVCLVSRSYLYSGCTPDATLSAGESLQGVVCSPYMDPLVLTVYGLLPDGVETVSAHFADGNTVDYDVANNFVNMVVPKSGPALSSMTWTDADGVAHAVSPLPTDANETTCSAAVSPSEASTWARAHEPDHQF
jgi:hypothetical protein